MACLALKVCDDHGKRCLCNPPNFLMKNSQAFTDVVCGHVTKQWLSACHLILDWVAWKQTLSPALDWVPWKQDSETRALCRWIVGGCFWMIPVRKWGRQNWAAGKLTCVAVVIKASSNSMGSSGARTDLKYYPKLRNYVWTSVFLHRQVFSSKPPLGSL